MADGTHQQLEKSRVLQGRIERLKDFDENRAQALSQDVQQYREVQEKKREVVNFKEQMLNRNGFRKHERER